MTRYRISPKNASVGRRKTNFDKMPAGFPAGTFAQMDEVLEPDETRKDLVRTAVRNELARRKKRRPKRPPSNDKD